MEQEQQTDNFDSTPPKNSLFAFFDAIKIKHIALFLLCMLFLSILIGGGDRQRPAKQLAIKGKKCKPAKNNNFTNAKNEVSNSIENFSAKSKNNINKIGNDKKCKTDEATENANATLKQSQQKAEQNFEDTPKTIEENKDNTVDVLKSKKQKLKNANKTEANAAYGKIKSPSKFEANNNGLAKGLRNIEENVKDEKQVAKESSLQEKPGTSLGFTQSSNTKSIENEIDLLKEELSQLKNRINQLSQSSNNQNNNNSSNNDEDFINQRIEFWQTIKENAQNQ